jgi:predicted pyridoxine 5'-phosphate oxidase superfamily flavin-nucleotide-binding protein
MNTRTGRFSGFEDIITSFGEVRSVMGDPVGFVHVLDGKHLAIPDRPGNRRADTLQNVLENPQLG